MKLARAQEILQKFYFSLLPTSQARLNYLIKHDVFDSIGENCFFQPRKLPADPKFIRLHNNVAVAADVTFVNHDVIYLVLRNLDPEQDYEHCGCIEIMDNVFIGLGSIILPGVKIGPNAIVAAGSIVTKDVPPGTVVGGSPAKVIGQFDDVVRKRLEQAQRNKENPYKNRGEHRAAYEWKLFEQMHESK